MSHQRHAVAVIGAGIAGATAARALALDGHSVHMYDKSCGLGAAWPPAVCLMTLAASGTALVTGARAQALLDEKDAQAIALGYVADAKRVDVKKFPKFVAGRGGFR